MDSLVELSKKLEIAAQATTSRHFASPRSQTSLIEPELAYEVDKCPAAIAETTASKTPVPSYIKQGKLNRRSEGPREPTVCFNCRLPNHSYASCTQKRRRFCFRYGKPEVTLTQCPNCSKTAPTVYRRHF